MNKKINKIEPRTLSGFMELLPNDQIKFNKLVDDVRRVYEKFGFLSIDTPIIELSTVVLVKAGGETEKQIYQFKKGDNDLVLRFDLTIPFAKYVAKNYHVLKFPFKKYQIGKVYRGERTQKGRYREFYQADIDIIGDNDLNIINDAEMPSVMYYVLKEIGLDNFTFRINNRKLLSGFYDILGLSDKIQDILRITDKIDKVELTAIKDELSNINITNEQINIIIEFINIKGSTEDIFSSIEKYNNSNNELFTKGLNELKQVIGFVRAFGISDEYLKVDLTITRGLDYYTGTIYETVLNGFEKYGSICSGGRYDNLAGYYTDKKLPGVGMSIGITRLFNLLQEENLLPDINIMSIKIMIIPLMDDITYTIKVSNILRNNDISNQIYYENKNLNSKINYANQLGIPYIIFVGEDEQNNNTVTIKNLKTREQKNIKIDDVVAIFKKQ